MYAVNCYWWKFLNSVQRFSCYTSDFRPVCSTYTRSSFTYIWLHSSCGQCILWLPRTHSHLHEGMRVPTLTHSANVHIFRTRWKIWHFCACTHVQAIFMNKWVSFHVSSTKDRWPGLNTIMCCQPSTSRNWASQAASLYWVCCSCFDHWSVSASCVGFMLSGVPSDNVLVHPARCIGCRTSLRTSFQWNMWCSSTSSLLE